MSDAELVARARDGDSSAFGELVDRHRTAVYRAALAALGSRSEADDAAQDAFVMAFERLHTFRGEASFKTWLLTIAWHQAINRRRSVSRWWKRTAGAGPDDQWFALRSDGPSPEQTAAAGSSARDRGRDSRAVVEAPGCAARAVRRVRYDEISRMLGIPLGTVKWRVSEARRQIRQRLERRGYVDVG